MPPNPKDARPAPYQPEVQLEQLSQELAQVPEGPRREARVAATSDAAAPAPHAPVRWRPTREAWLLAAAAIPLASILGLLRPATEGLAGLAAPPLAEGLLLAWTANLWGDLVFAGGIGAIALGTAWGVHALRRTANPSLPAAALPAAFLGAWAVFSVAASFSAVPAAQTLVASALAAQGVAATPPGFAYPEFTWFGAGEAFTIGWPGIVAVATLVPAAAFLLDRRAHPVTVARTPAPAIEATPAPAKPAFAAQVNAKPWVDRLAAKNGDVKGLTVSDPHAWMERTGLEDTSQIPLPQLLIDEVIGQEEAVAVAKKAARQRRHLLLLGDPGTGKSMIAKAMAQILPPTQLDDVLCLPNPKDQNMPKVKVLPGGQGRTHALEMQQKAKRMARLFTIFEVALSLLLVGGGFAAFLYFAGGVTGLILMVLCFMAAVFFIFVSRQISGKPTRQVPNLLIERPDQPVPAPYVDATGSHHGALLGDVRHDPFQSGGLQTPTHQRVEPGAIHRAHKGLLFIDEINVLRLDSQQALLTAMQEKRYAITGQSERSSGAMARTEAVPCDFILVAAGNLDVIAPTDNRYTGLHPALRSRIRGYGYEVFVRSVMEDTDENRRKLVRFVAQEVRRDGSIPHFSAPAVAEVLREAQRRSGHTGKLTLRLRELGGLVRTAGDLARDDGAPVVGVEHVLAAKRMSMSLEYQVTRRGIEVTTAKEAQQVEGTRVGRAVGCAFLGTGETGEPAGIVVPIEADATVSSDRQKGTVFYGGGLDRHRGVSDNLGATLKRLRGSDMAGIDLHVQALLEHDGATVNALGAAAAVASVSALEDLPVRQDTAIVGELAVGGRLRAVEGVTQMIEGAADLGYARAIVPSANAQDILLEHAYRDRIEVVLADTLADVLEHALQAPAARKHAVQATLRGRSATGKSR